jgi:transposase
MGQGATEFKVDTLTRKKIEKRRRKEKDARIHKRLSALLWLNQGYSAEEVAQLLDVCPRTVRNWVALYREQGLDGLCSLAYQGDPG